MHSQKIRLLRQLCASEILPSLPAKVLRLYLLLLVSAGQIGREETIVVTSIRRALGRRLTRRQMLRIGAALEYHGLATLRPSLRPLKSVAGEERWHFRLLRGG